MRECPRCQRCYEDEALACPEDGNSTRHTMPGSTLVADRYSLEKALGHSPMCQSYLATDKRLGTRRVVVKTFSPSSIIFGEDVPQDEIRACFERGARDPASVRHPNVIDVTDFGQTKDGVLYLVMEYVDGETLHSLLKRQGRLSLQGSLTLLRQIVAAVEAAHDLGMVHLDLKPDNIFIMQRKSGSGRSGDSLIKVGDFGQIKIISNLAGLPISSSTKASHSIIGTPEYMAPEQMQPEAGIGARADLYALGGIAYHMLSGRPPFKGDLMEVIARKLAEAPTPLSNLRSDVPVEVGRAVMHALEREPDARPANVSEWFEEFAAAADMQSDQVVSGKARVVIIGPPGAEIYIDEERHGKVGSLGRLVLFFTAGAHVLRVSQMGRSDYERVIEISHDSSERIIEMNHRLEAPTVGSPSPSRGAVVEAGSDTGPLPDIVACAQCSARFAAGVRVCGRCGGTRFQNLRPAMSMASPPPAPGAVAQQSSGPVCQRCGSMYLPGARFCGRCGIALLGPSAPLETTIVNLEIRDEVSCSVFSPAAAHPGDHLLIQVFAHLPEQTTLAKELALEADEETTLRGAEALETEIERGSILRFHLAVPGIEIDPPTKTLKWRGRAEAVRFEARIPEDHNGGNIIGTVTVSRDTVPIGHIKFKLTILNRATARAEASRYATEERLNTWIRYKKAFVSYASQDRAEVLKRVQMLSALGITFFQDVLTLRPGAQWKKELYHHIDESDVFLLFWSSSARQSEWVMEEVRYAQGRKRGDDLAPPEIVPVIIEGPPTVDPPPELAHLHFGDYEFYFTA